MNNISSNITASSILSGKVQVPAAKQENQAPVEDKVEISSSKNQEEKTHFLSVKDNEGKKKAMLIGAGIGGVAGGVAGGLIGNNMAKEKIMANNDINSISLDWKEPAMQSENLGQIPANYYQPNNLFGWVGGGNGMTSVIRQNPVMENGKPVMLDKSQTFTDYGKPVVEWKNKNIYTSTLNGYHSSITPDTSYETVYAGRDSNGNAIYVEREKIDGYYHNFSPNIQQTNVGTYQTPKVKFETGVSTGLYTTLGALAGAGVGALSGALTGAAIDHIMNK